MITHLLTLANSGAYSGKREFFYPFKDRFLRRWARRDGHDKQVLTRGCYACGGTGRHYRFWGQWIYVGSCYKCGDSGVYRVDTIWLERWVFGGRVFHIPVPAWNLPILISPPVVTYTAIIKHSDVDHDRAWHAALTLFAIFEIETLARIVWASARNRVRRIFRGVRNWWLERQIGPIPF